MNIAQIVKQEMDEHWGNLYQYWCIAGEWFDRKGAEAKFVENSTEWVESYHREHSEEPSEDALRGYLNEWEFDTECLAHTEYDMERLFENSVDEYVIVMGYTYNAAYVLRQCDEAAYREQFLFWLDDLLRG